MITTYLLNYFTPLLAGKLQVGSTLIKLIPLTLIGVVGIFTGLTNGLTLANYQEALGSVGSASGTLASAVVATAFAYEGWIVAVTINGEIKDSKRNLPLALTIGTAIIFVVYVLYFLGVAGALPTSTIVFEGDNAVSLASNLLFDKMTSTILTVFVVVSCLGTLNGLVMSTMRVPFSLAIRGQGPFPKLMSKVDEKTKMPINSARFAGLLSFAYLTLWLCSINEVFGRYIGLDEIPIVMMYGLYILLYIWYMRTFTDLGFIKRFVFPISTIFGALIILYGGISNPSIGLYLLVSVGILLFGLVFYRHSSLDSN
jgi:APA family basic amino acid/polyamine antiporter